MDVPDAPDVVSTPGKLEELATGFTVLVVLPFGLWGGGVLRYRQA